MKGKGLILLYPRYSGRIGYGHLKRCGLLARILHTRFRTRILKGTGFRQVLSLVKKEKPALLILDWRCYRSRMVRELSRYCDLLLMDAPRLFPVYKKSVYINPATPLSYRFLSPDQFHYQGLSWMPLEPALIRLAGKKNRDREGLAVSFGNSDPNGLSLRTLKYLKKTGYAEKLTLIIGPHFRKKERERIKDFLNRHFPQAAVYENRQNIIPVLARSRYLISSFGLTALEGALLSCRTALFNNSPYHSRLAASHDLFFPLGTFRHTLPFLIPGRIKKFLGMPSSFAAPADPDGGRRIKDLLPVPESPAKPEECPVCAGRKNSLLLNQAEKTVWACAVCHSKFLRPGTVRRPESIYTAAYFQDEYKNRYGRTYLQDRKNILELSEQRLNTIAGLLENRVKGKRILDAGCAYGFFLEKAREKGFIPAGVETGKEAARYASERLRLDVRQGDFLKCALKERFHVITFWYVFEHFPDPGRAVKKTLSLLEEGGLLCLSLPDGNGPFFKYNRTAWLAQHPDDHYFDYSAKGLCRFMSRYGFRLMKKKTAGFHPERYRDVPAFLRPLLKFLGQGDTMECYFQKKPV